jgi:hypothetical protein
VHNAVLPFVESLHSQMCANHRDILSRLIRSEWDCWTLIILDSCAQLRRQSRTVICASRPNYSAHSSSTCCESGKVAEIRIKLFLWTPRIMPEKLDLMRHWKSCDDRLNTFLRQISEIMAPFRDFHWAWISIERNMRPVNRSGERWAAGGGLISGTIDKLWQERRTLRFLCNSV